MMKTVKDRLKLAYNEQDKFRSYAALSRAAGIKSSSTVSDLFRGHTGEESPALTALALVLGVNPIWLQRGRGPMRGEGPTLVDIAALDNPKIRKAAEAAEQELANGLMKVTAAYLAATAHGRKQILSMAARSEKKGQSAVTTITPTNGESLN